MMNGISTIFGKSNRLKSKTPDEPSLQNTQCLNYYSQHLTHYPYQPNPYPPTQTSYHHQVYQPQQPLVQATIPVQPQSACLHHCPSQIIQPTTYQTHNNLRNGTIDPRPVDQSMMMNANNHMNGHIPQATQQQFVTTMPAYPNNMMQSVPIASQPSRCSENNFYINHNPTLAYQQQQQQQSHQHHQHQNQNQNHQQHQHYQQQQQQHNHQHQQHQLQQPSQVQRFQHEELRQRQQQQIVHQVSQNHLELHKYEEQHQEKEKQQQQQPHVHQQQQQQYQNHTDLANGQNDEGLSLEVLSMMHDKDNEELEKLADGLKNILDNLSKRLEMIRRGTPKYSVTEANI